MWRKNLFLILSFILIVSFLSHCLPPRYFPKADQKALQNALELYHQGKQEPALAAFKSFTARFPQSTYLSEALFYIGIIYRQKKEPGKALEYFNQSLRYSPPVQLQGQIYKQAGLSYSQLKAYQGAIKYYKKALHMSSRPEEKGEISLLLGRSYQKMGNSSQALKEYLRALKYKPGVELMTRAKDGLINLILEISNTNELVPLKEEKDLAEETRGYVYYRLAELYFSHHEHEAARKALQEYNRLFPTHPYQEKATTLLRKIDELILSISQSYTDRIGCILPLSGKYGPIGQKILNGIKLAFLTASIPAGKGEYRLVVKDSGTIPQKVMSALEALATQEKVLAVIGPVLDEELKSVTPIAAKYHIALVSPSAADGARLQPNPYIFRTIPNIRQWGRQMADFAIKKLYLTTLAILYPYTPYGTQLKDSFSERVVELGGNISKIVSYKAASSDLATELRDLVGYGSSGLSPQSIFLPEDYYGLRLIAPQLAYYLANQVVLLSCCYKEPPPLGDIKRGGLEGAIFMVEFFLSSTDPKIKVFVDSFKKTFGIEPDYWAALGYDAANIIFHILQQYTVQNRESVKDLLLGIKYFSGVTGRITFLPDGTAEKTPFILKIEGGQFVQLN